MGGSEEHILPSNMALRMAAALQSPGKFCSFSYVLLVFLLFYVLDVVSITVYDRDTLLNIGSSVTQRKPFTNLICLTENLDVCNGSRLSHRAHRLLRAPLG